MTKRAHHTPVAWPSHAHRRVPACRRLRTKTQACLAFAVLLGAVRAAPAQDTSPPDTLFEVTGTIRNATGDVLPGAHVFVGQGRTGTTSDNNGSYLLALRAGTYSLTCSALGFRPVSSEIRVSADMEVDCTLEDVVIEAGEIVVIASRRPQLARDVPSSLEVLSAERLATRNSRGLDDALSTVSGVQVQGNQVNIRGTSGFAYNTGSRVLLLIDGMPLLSPDSDGIPLEALPLTQVQQVEVLKGPGSALYGSGALGGVVNVVTKPPPDDREIAVRAYVGAYEPTRHERWANRWHPAEEWRPFGGVGVSVANSWRPGSGGWVALDYRTDPGFRNLSTFSQLQVLSKGTWQTSSQTDVSVLAGVLARRRDTYLFWNGLNDALNPGSVQLSQASTPSGSNDTFTNQLMLQPQLRHRFAASILTVRARGFAALIRPINDDGSLKPLSQGTVGTRVGAETQWQKFVSGTTQVIAGVAVDANLTRSSFYRTDDGGSAGRQPEVGVYGQLEAQPVEGLALVGGARFDWFRISSAMVASRVSPKLALGLTLAPWLALRASAGLGFRVPSLAERYTDDQSFFPIFRNPVLRPEKSSSIELGARGDIRPTAIFALNWDVAVFSYGLQDLIEPRFVRAETTDGTQLGFQFVNVPDGWVRGLEATVEAALGESMRVRGGYTHLSTRERSSGEPLPFRPKHLLVAGVMADRGRLNLGLDFRYASTPEVIDSDFARFVPDADVLVDTRVVDVSGAFRAGPVQVRLIVRNALNYYYLERPALLAPPRHVVLQLTGAL